MPDKKPTDSEIVKALKDTLHRIKGAEHLIVPKEGIKNLCNGLENALDLINRYEAEKEALISGQETLQKHIATLQAENESLKNAYKQCAWERDVFQTENERLSRITRTMVGEIKAEAMTEFAEELDKASFITGYTVGYGGKDIPIKHITMANIRSILKEMVGDNNETICKYYTYYASIMVSVNSGLNNFQNTLPKCKSTQ